MFFRLLIISFILTTKSYSQENKGQVELIKDSLLNHKSFIGDKILELKNSIKLIDSKIDSLNIILELEKLKKQSVVTSIRKEGSIYSMASRYSSNIGEVQKKQKVYVLDYSEHTNYFKVIANNKIGYVYEKNLIVNKALKLLKKKVKYKLRSSNNYRSSSNYKKSSSNGRVHVRGYYRKDGTYVRPHTRSKPKRRKRY